MTVVFAVVLVVHGLIHVLGFVKAFGLADLPQLTQPVSPSLGVLWLLGVRAGQFRLQPVRLEPDPRA